MYLGSDDILLVVAADSLVTAGWPGKDFTVNFPPVLIRTLITYGFEHRLHVAFRFQSTSIQNTNKATERHLEVRLKTRIARLAIIICVSFIKKNYDKNISALILK